MASAADEGGTVAPGVVGPTTLATSCCAGPLGIFDVDSGVFVIRDDFGSWLAAAALILTGCGSAPPPPAPKIVDAAPVPEKIDTGPTFYETETGGLNEEAMDDAFNKLQ